MTSKEIENLQSEIAELKLKLAHKSELEEFLFENFSASPDAITVTDLEANEILIVNQATEHLLGYTPSEWVGASPDKFNVWVDKKSRDEFFNWLKNKDNSDFYETELRHRDGSTFYAHITGKLIKQNGKVLSVTTIRDITPFISIQKALEASNQKFRVIFELSITPMMLFEIQPLKLIDTNSAASKLLGEKTDLSSEVAIHSLWLNPKDLQSFRNQVFESLYCSGLETEMMIAGGTSCPVLVSARIITINDEAQMLFNIQDLRLQKQNEASVFESKQRLEVAQDIASVGDFVWNIDEKTLSSSKECSKLLGIAPSLQDFTYATLISLVRNDTALQALQSDAPEAVFEFQMLEGNNNVEWLLCKAKRNYDRHGRLTLVTGIIQDITARKQHEHEQQNLKQQMLHAQKLESLGVMAGGVAHDFNNLLTSILGNADLALISVNDPPEVTECLEYIIAGCHRAADLTHQLLAYSGKGNFVIESMDLNKLILELGKLLQISVEKNCTVTYNLDEALPIFEGDRSQIQQIIMNLIINASEAIDGVNGSISVSTGIDIDPSETPYEFIEKPQSNEPHIFLEVSDTGRGMDKATLARIFEPFFTTKFTGRGLGMSALLGIIRSHKSAITVTSTLGVGTTFRILLPIKQLSKPIDPLVKPVSKPLMTATVLIVDDEHTVRNVLKRQLDNMGFNTLTANNGEQALAILEKGSPNIDLVLLDLTMPVMSGQETLPHIQSLYPKAKVIIMSGYSEIEAVKLLDSKRKIDFITKPFDLEKLRWHIESILG